MAGVLHAIQLSAKGLTIQRKKMNVVAENLANAETTKTADGGPYQRKRLLVREAKEAGNFDSFLRQADTPLARTHPEHKLGNSFKVREDSELASVEAKQVEQKDSFKLIYDPTHPEADEEGYVKLPDIDIITEMVDMMVASRAYEANTTAIAASKKMVKDALDI
ncbi:MAG: flagellar basal body rod protein FlgC [bacterium]|nr:flagellar basal body rod protein FlgC [bacterium]